MGSGVWGTVAERTEVHGSEVTLGDRNRGPTWAALASSLAPWWSPTGGVGLAPPEGLPWGDREHRPYGCPSRAAVARAQGILTSPPLIPRPGPTLFTRPSLGSLCVQWIPAWALVQSGSMARYPVNGQCPGSGRRVSESAHGGFFLREELGLHGTHTDFVIVIPRTVQHRWFARHAHCIGDPRSSAGGLSLLCRSAPSTEGT